MIIVIHHFKKGSVNQIHYSLYDTRAAFQQQQQEEVSYWLMKNVKDIFSVKAKGTSSELYVRVLMSSLAT